MLYELIRFKEYKELNPCKLTPQQMASLEVEIKHHNILRSSDEYVDFTLWMNNLPLRQERFAKYISRRLKNHPNAKLLEVGCGRLGRLSKLLAKEGFLMTGIDPKLEVSSTDTIRFYKQKFDCKTAILDDYDYVIAQEPCDATEHIIRACLNQNKPFMISLCGSPHKLISGENPKDVYDWFDCLVNIAPDKLVFRWVEFDPFFKTPILRSKIF